MIVLTAEVVSQCLVVSDYSLRCSVTLQNGKVSPLWTTLVRSQTFELPGEQTVWILPKWQLQEVFLLQGFEASGASPTGSSSMEGEQISKVEKGTRDHHQYLCYPLCCENEEVAAKALFASVEEYLQLAFSWSGYGLKKALRIAAAGGLDVNKQ